MKWRDLFQIANQKISWYSLRHTVGNYLSEIAGINTAIQLLRHENIQTTEEHND